MLDSSLRSVGKKDLRQASQQKKSDRSFRTQSKPGQLNKGHLVTGKLLLRWGQGEPSKLKLTVAKPGKFRKRQSKQKKLFGLGEEENLHQSLSVPRESGAGGNSASQ